MYFGSDTDLFYINAAKSVRWYSERRILQKNDSDVKIKNPFNLTEAKKFNDDIVENKFFMMESSYVLNSLIDNYYKSIIKIAMQDGKITTDPNTNNIDEDSNSIFFREHTNKRLFINHQSPSIIDSIKWYDRINIKKLLIGCLSCNTEELKKYKMIFQNLYYDIRLNLKSIASFYIVYIYKRLSEIKKDLSILESEEYLKWVYRFNLNVNRRESYIYEFIRQESINYK